MKDHEGETILSSASWVFSTAAYLVALGQPRRGAELAYVQGAVQVVLQHSPCPWSPEPPPATQGGTQGSVYLPPILGRWGGGEGG